MKNNISLDSMNALIAACKDQPDDLKAVFEALCTFESYHQAVVRETGFHRVFLNSTSGSPENQNQYSQFDRSRTIGHNAVIVYLQMLNQLTELYKVPLFYTGSVSEDYPHRREIGDAILQFLHDLVDSRF